MRLGIIGSGNVGCAIAFAALTRGSAREIVLVNRTSKTAEAVATDLRYGTPLGPKVDIQCGNYEALSGAEVVLITSGVNEKTGGATDRSDPQGRLRLLEKNAKVILCSHLGRPKGQRDPKQSLKPVAAALSNMIGRPVEFADDCVGADAKAKALALAPGA